MDEDNNDKDEEEIDDISELEEMIEEGDDEYNEIMQNPY